MKWFARTLIFTFMAIWLTEILISGFSIKGGLLSHMVVSLGMIGMNIFVKPIVKIVVLPINIATLGMFTFIINAVLLWILSYFIPGITISSWTFEGLYLLGITIPKIQFGILSTYIVTAFCISGIIMLLQWIRK